MALDIMPDLLDLLACPACKGRLDYTDDAEGLLCSDCRLVYRIEDEIPVLLVEEAVSEAEWDKKRNDCRQ